MASHLPAHSTEGPHVGRHEQHERQRRQRMGGPGRWSWAAAAGALQAAIAPRRRPRQVWAHTSSIAPLSSSSQIRVHCSGAGNAAGRCCSARGLEPCAEDRCVAADARVPPPPLPPRSPSLLVRPPATLINKQLAAAVEAYLTATNLDALEAEGELLPHEARALEALRAAAAAAARPVQSGTALYQQLAASELLSTVRQVEVGLCSVVKDAL